MQRRNSLATNGSLSGLDPAYLAAKEKLAAGKAPRRPPSEAAVWTHQGKALDHRLRRHDGEGRDRPRRRPISLPRPWIEA